MALLFSFKKQFHLQPSLFQGAWQLQKGNEEEILLFKDGYFTHTTYNQRDKQFIQTRGGTYTTSTNNTIAAVIEFDTRNKDRIGQTENYQFATNRGLLQTDLNGMQQNWKQLDNGTAPLAGVWHITARMQNGSLTPIHQTGPRKTIKILTGTRFQWAAINPETKEFFGTGGGTYTFTNGKYTEQIAFFSRDSSRVGAALTFDGKLQNGDWHHSGLSSRGEKIYEVWGKVK
ncbi:MAG: membrane or secreted protein [Flavisolibacter sp.]|nr:membrane or secreted protein [Flavisolibacter sp.]